MKVYDIVISIIKKCVLFKTNPKSSYHKNEKWHRSAVVIHGTSMWKYQVIFLSRTQVIKRLKKNAKEPIYRILLSLEMTLFADIRYNMRKCESVLSFYYYLYLFILIM